MKKKIALTVLLLLLWWMFSTLFYKTVCVMLLVAVWRNELREKLPEKFRTWGMRAVWIVLALVLWTGMPRYRINSGDRTRLIFVEEKDGKYVAKHPPIGQYILNTLLPEEEVCHACVNFTGLAGVEMGHLMKKLTGHGLDGFIKQAEDDYKAGKSANFLTTYDNLGLDNPMAAVYTQALNTLGDDEMPAYVCSPKDYDEDKAYPLVVYCHGLLGNWLLYQGIWKDLDDCVVLSIGTRDMSGIFKANDLNRVFSHYMLLLNDLGYKIDKSQVHLIGVSNGGSAISTALHTPSLAQKFKSVTAISCGLGNLCKVPCLVNFIGGGKDGLSNGMRSQCKKMKAMGVDSDIFWDADENHYLMINRRADVTKFLKGRMQLRPQGN